MYLGPLQNVNIMRLFWIFKDGDCDSVLVTYPGQEFTFTDFTDGTCQNTDAQFGSIYTETVKLE